MYGMVEILETTDQDLMKGIHKQRKVLGKARSDCDPRGLNLYFHIVLLSLNDTRYRLLLLD